MMIKRKRRKMAIMVPIASMGDIAFLLIIFFILASNFAKEAHIDFDPAKSPDIEKMERSQVSVTVDKDGQVWLQGEECPVDLLEGVKRCSRPTGRRWRSATGSTATGTACWWCEPRDGLNS